MNEKKLTFYFAPRAVQQANGISFILSADAFAVSFGASRIASNTNNLGEHGVAFVS